MSKSLFLVKYQDQNYYDDTSEILEQTPLREDVYEKLKEYIGEKYISETKDSTEEILINYINDENLIKIINDILIPACIKGSEQIDKKIIDSSNTEEKLFLLGDLINILKILSIKRDKYNKNLNILVMVG
ncbi:hypothetical protein [Neisseria montereyensis]|uniref:Uncharacterized protein n=1 Tax=Neisseria montereyensis TaxID=2973938 RepID=A0ABT2FET2_9NEIS|nr:hypothetical protein [Neisseria montereyensis]MCS4534033.1 hypothetical protein [Neisseria montereyensis]